MEHHISSAFDGHSYDQGHDDLFPVQAGDATRVLSPQNQIAHEKSSQAFRTISEVAAEIDVPQHVLRFWESKFTQIRPLKRGGGRRYYRPDDIELLRRIKNYLYKQGYTIKGVQRLLKENRSMAHTQASAPQAQAKNFMPYAHPLANLPPYPLNPIMNSAAYLHAAAAAPSAMALAYGMVSSTIERENQQVREYEQKAERFADQIAGVTAQFKDEAENPNVSRAEQSLEAITQIHDALAHPAQPIRLDANEDAVLEAMEIMEASPEVAPDVASSPMLNVPQVVEPELDFTPAAQPATVEPAVAEPAQPAEVAAAAQPEEAPAFEEISQDEYDDEFTGDADEEIEAADAEEEIEAATIIDVPVEIIVEAIREPAQPAYPTAELKALLAELVSLRAMLNNGAEA